MIALRVVLGLAYVLVIGVAGLVGFVIADVLMRRWPE